MDMIASQITSLTIVYSTVYSDADQRKHKSSAPLAFISLWHWNMPVTVGSELHRKVKSTSFDSQWALQLCLSMEIMGSLNNARAKSALEFVGHRNLLDIEFSLCLFKMQTTFIGASIASFFVITFVNMIFQVRTKQFIQAAVADQITGADTTVTLHISSGLSFRSTNQHTE